MEMLHPEWSYQAVLYEMNVRQLTAEGTLRAAAAKLGFLRDMGIDAVWLMPVYPIGVEGRKGSLGSYYSVRDYCAVDPCLGTMEDFDAFVAEAHRLGMKVLLDWIANHTARDARWVTEKPASWYERDASGAPAVPWDWTDTAKLNYAEREVWRAQGDAMEFWVREHGVDGFRCDMAMLVPIEFWNETAQRLRRVKPDLFMLAEAEETYLFDGGAFDACYAWEMHHLMNDVAQQRVRVTSLRDYIYADRRRYPRSAMRLAFTSNHDENSWNGSEFARMGAAREIMAVFTFVVPRGLLHRAGDRLRPFVRLLRPRPASRLRIQSLFGVLPPSDGAAARQSGARIGRTGRRDDRDTQQRRGLPDDCGPRGGGQLRRRGHEPLALCDPCRLLYGHLRRHVYRRHDGPSRRTPRPRRGGYGAVELPHPDPLTLLRRRKKTAARQGGLFFAFCPVTSCRNPFRFRNICYFCR